VSAAPRASTALSAAGSALGSAPVSTTAAPAVELSGISKAFVGVKVLKDVSFDVGPGEIHALLRENGAGKSTLIKVLAGVHQPDTGTIRIAGETVRLTSPRHALSRGIATIYQELLLFPELTVAENIFIGHGPRRAWGGLDWSAMRDRARALLDGLDSADLDVDVKVGTLSVANRQRVEIAKALSHEARVLIMDEPTASLAEGDVLRLIAVVKRLRDQGVAIIYVSHRLPEIFELADRVTVLRDGAHVGTHAIGDVDEAALVSMMVGRPLDRMFPRSDAVIGATVLEARGLSDGRKVFDIDLDLRAGEIVGIAGLVGSGRTELALTLFGVTPAVSGEIRLDGRPVRIAGPRAARNLGIAYVPEDRAQQGLVRPMPIGQNISMAMLDRLARGIVIRAGEEWRRAEAAMRTFDIRARGPGQPAAELSGGNQQKVVLAKWLETGPRVLILDEPTRGIDVGAKAEIYHLMAELARQGKAILMISSELPEVIGMSDRVMVMSGGRFVARFDRADASPDAVGRAMTGAAAKSGPGAAGDGREDAR
jgi:ABC-type sugar transport system ATPase subunit